MVFITGMMEVLEYLKMVFPKYLKNKLTIRSFPHYICPRNNIWQWGPLRTVWSLYTTFKNKGISQLFLWICFAHPRDAGFCMRMPQTSSSMVRLWWNTRLSFTFWPAPSAPSAVHAELLLWPVCVNIIFGCLAKKQIPQKKTALALKKKKMY